MTGPERGLVGERLAKHYLESVGYRILQTNFRSRWGEIDIISVDPEGALIFCEVKSYSMDAMVNPLEAITPGKVKRIEKTIQFFLMKNPAYFEWDMRIEVVVTDGSVVREHLKTLI